MSNEPELPVYSWGGSVAFALAGTAAVVGLILVFTGLERVLGQFWAQVIYFPSIFAFVIAAALRSRRMDEAHPTRLTRPAPITPAGLPGPFVVTQGLGVAGVVMVVAGALIGGPARIMWVASGFVCVLVGAVGLAFWLSGRPWQHHSRG